MKKHWGGMIKVTPFTHSLRYAAIECGARRVTSYQKVHGLSKLLSHLQLPQDIYRALVLFQVSVQGAELDELLNHYVWKTTALQKLQSGKGR